jgi:hypothetical protein
MLGYIRNILKDLHNDRSGVSEVYGYILVIGITVAGLAIILMTGTFSINDAKDNAQLNAAEQAFTVADSRISKARFSTSIYQSTPFELKDGTIFVNGTEDDSYIEVYGINNELVYRGALGTIKYVSDQGEVAYQDGGVWMKSPDGGSLMLSPPDFDYNGVTLTLPIMKIDGNSSTAIVGGAQAILDVNSSADDLTPIFPSSEGSNPIPEGYIINISIKSDYYDAWAKYINERTRASAEVIPDKKLVNVSLKTGRQKQSNLFTQGFDTIGMDTSFETPIEIFDVNAYLRNSGNDYMVTFGRPAPSKNNSPDPQLLITVARTTGHDNKVYAEIEYLYTNGTTKERFHTYYDFQRKLEGKTDGGGMELDMLDHTVNMTYMDDSIAKSITWGALDKSDVYDEGEVIGFDNSSDISIGTNKTLHDVTQHYMWLMANNLPDIGPTYEELKKDHYDEDSYLVLQYRSSQDIKYLFITEGVVRASISTKVGNIKDL